MILNATWKFYISIIMRHYSENVCRWTASRFRKESTMEDFHARKNSIDGCAALKGRMSDGDWTSKGGTEWSPVASTSDDGHEKVDCVRIMKEIPNGVENTGNPPSVLSTFLTPFLAPNPVAPPQRSHCNWTSKFRRSCRFDTLSYSHSIKFAANGAVESVAIGGFYL